MWSVVSGPIVPQRRFQLSVFQYFSFSAFCIHHSSFCILCSKPDHNLGVGSGPQGAQTAKILEAYEKLLLEGERPRGIIVVGDVNSTMGCALAAARLPQPVSRMQMRPQRQSK